MKDQPNDAVCQTMSCRSLVLLQRCTHIITLKLLLITKYIQHLTFTVIEMSLYSNFHHPQNDLSCLAATDRCCRLFSVCFSFFSFLASHVINILKREIWFLLQQLYNIKNINLITLIYNMAQMLTAERQIYSALLLLVSSDTGSDNVYLLVLMHIPVDNSSTVCEFQVPLHSEFSAH